MNNHPVILVHGIFGWGPNEIPINYWGRATHAKSPLKIIEASVGPVSSYHDRACELAAQIKGTQVDYGAKHSNDFAHDPKSVDYSQRGGHYEVWSEKNPVHLVGHSAGGHTILALQQLLEEDFWGWKSNANWIKSISGISAVFNGSTLPYMLGCNEKSGAIEGIGSFILYWLKLFNVATNGSLDSIYDFDLDHWGLKREEGENIGDFFEKIKKSKFGINNDNLAYDLTLQGCFERNKIVKTYEKTYYFSYITEQTSKGWLWDDYHYPDPLMNPVLLGPALYQGRKGFSHPPIPGWGKGELEESKWYCNDGCVAAASQKYPFTAGNHTVHGEGISNRKVFKPGGWYHEKIESSTNRSWDHGDIVFGMISDLTLFDKQEKWYSRLFNRLSQLD